MERVGRVQDAKGFVSTGLPGMTNCKEFGGLFSTLQVVAINISHDSTI